MKSAIACHPNFARACRRWATSASSPAALPRKSSQRAARPSSSGSRPGGDDEKSSPIEADTGPVPAFARTAPRIEKGALVTRARVVAPPHLRSATAEWWRSVCRDFILEPHHVRLLTLAAEAWDRCQDAREAVAKDGLTVSTQGGGLKAHPAVGIERDARLAFARLLRELDLDLDAPAELRRPPALRSNSSAR